MSIGRLGVGSEQDVGVEIQRALAIGCHGRVVGDDDCARSMGGLCHRPDVTDIKPRVGRGFDEHHAVSGKPAFEKRRGRSGFVAYAKPGQVLFQQDAGRVIAIRGQEHPVAA